MWPLFAQAQHESLVENSPFLPEGYQVRQAAPEPVRPPSPTQDATRFLQFKGIYQLNGIYHANIMDSREGREGRWYRMQEPIDGRQVLSYDPERQRVVFEINGQRYNLDMERPDHRPIPVVTSAPAPHAQPGQVVPTSSVEQHARPPRPPQRVMPPRPEARQRVTRPPNVPRSRPQTPND